MLEYPYSGILEYRRVKSRFSNVDGINESSSVLEQTIGETAGGSANVHADLPLHSAAKLAESRFQLDPTAANISFRLDDLERCVGRDGKTGFETGEGSAVNSASQDQPLGFFSRLCEPTSH
jgi:hypothetical protein